MRPPQTLYAHIAIPKTGSTTLVHVLRLNFFMRCLEVRPLSPASKKVFSARDLAVSLRLNPAIECITGHAVHPYSDLDKVVNEVKYFTTLRDPVERCISAYFYGSEVRGQSFTFEQHLHTEGKENLQTKWIAGAPDLEAAKEILEEKVWLIGRTERLAEFVLMLNRNIKDRPFDPHFQSKNLRGSRPKVLKESPASILERFGDEIVYRNRLDIDLIEHVENVVLPRQRAHYGTSLTKDIGALQASTQRAFTARLYPYLDYVVRKLYYDPVIGLLRTWNGLTYGERI